MIGPVFRLVDWNVPWLRHAKLVGFVGSGMVLGYAVSRITHQYANSPTLRATSVVVLFVTLGSFTAYSWAPQSPGYNDIVAIPATLAAAGTIMFVTSDGRHRLLG